MEPQSDNELHLGDASRRIAQRMFVIAENRFQLLMVEVQEERERALRAILLGLCTVAFGLLAGIALTIVIAVALWERSHSPLIALLVLTAIYTIAALVFYQRLFSMQRDWQSLPGTLDQLKKDRECLEKTFI